MSKLGNKIENVFNSTGHLTLLILEKIGEFIYFIYKSFYQIFKPPFYMAIFKKQCMNIGFYSLPVVAMTTFFAGMVLALQAYTGINPILAETTIPTIVVLSITRELAPVLAGLMVAGRIGASIAAEIGTMRVTEQIDALQTLNTNPIAYLIVPRVLAGFLTLPLLVLIGDVLGLAGGYLVSTLKLGLNPANYIAQTVSSLSLNGVISGLTKASVFGLITTLMGCYQGFRSTGGAQGVGLATTNAVVWSSILILIANYIITEIFVGL